MKIDLLRRYCKISFLSISLSLNVYGQVKNAPIDRYFEKLPHDLKMEHNIPQKYLMTEEYFNKGIDGNFMNKTKVTGEYTCGLGDGYVQWNNVYIAYADSLKKVFPKGAMQNYMENMKYVPSGKMLDSSSFEKFPVFPDGIFAKNLIWDMMAIESYAWLYFDSLKLNCPYFAAETYSKVPIANLGLYEHTNVQICWIGISMINNEICAIIEYRAFDNIFDFNTPQFKSKGNEHYWGNVWVSLKDKQIEYAVMYSSTLQKLKITGLPQDLVVNTTREVRVEKTN
jgi:hypothetical protein